MAWPVMVDALNVTSVDKVPLTWAIDEHGIIRQVNPDPETIEETFVNRTFPAPSSLAAPLNGRPDLTSLQLATTTGGAAAWRDYGDAVFLWGDDPHAAIDVYRRALTLDASHAPTQFRLGVALRRRYESPWRQAGDFQQAVNAWSSALALNPNQYIWLRRLQQYGPRFDKPYPFYDWVDTASADIQARGEEPVVLPVEPRGSEIARPARMFSDREPTPAHPDPHGRVYRDGGEFIQVETVVVPGAVAPGGAVRTHLVFRPNTERQAHWNNEANPLQVWLDPPDGWPVENHVLAAPLPPEPVSEELRTVEFELLVPADFPQGTANVIATAFYYVCEDRDGTCLYRRRDLAIRIPVQH